MIDNRSEIYGIFEGLRIVELPGVNPPSHLKTEYKNAYELWHRVWSSTFEELKGVSRLYSDDFTRQEDVICLFEGSKCLFTIFFRKADITNPAIRNDSYFASWDEASLDALARDSSETIIYSYITVNEEARRGYRGLPLKKLIVAAGVQYFLESGGSSMTATSRNGKGINKVVEQYGATPIKLDQTMHGVPVDIAIFYKKEVSMMRNEWQDYLEPMWERRATYKQKTAQLQILKAA
jgi:hypothetical protein